MRKKPTLQCSTVFHVVPVDRKHLSAYVKFGQVLMTCKWLLNLTIRVIHSKQAKHCHIVCILFCVCVYVLVKKELSKVL